MDYSEQTLERARQTDHAEDARSTSPTKVSKPGWGYIIKRSIHSFTSHGGTDLAASMTFFTVLSIFPGLLAVVSLLGVFGQGKQTTTAILNFLEPHTPQNVMTLIEQPISQLTTSSGAGIALITGVLGALWTASGYVGGFGRALNQVYGVVEGRPIWLLRPINLVVTFVMVIIVVIMMMTVLLSGNVLRFFGDFIGVGDTAVSIWSWARWIVVLALAIALIALLYYATPNIRQPKLRWMSPGAGFALLTMGLAGLGFGFYVSNFGNYNATYGTLGGVIVMLLALWIMNNVLLFGAVLDSEIERGRELGAGLMAEREIQLPPRDIRQAKKILEQRKELIAEGRSVRLSNDHLDYSTPQD